MRIEVKITKLREGALIPAYAHGSGEDAGVDLTFCGEARIALEPGERRLFPTGLAIELPPGYEGQVRPRSGLALKKGVTVLNAPGTIDEDYRGELSVIVLNAGAEPFTVERGMRIAQAVLAPVTRAAWREVDALPATARGTGGFGSTGTG